jgi:hypothetical protein
MKWVYLVVVWFGMAIVGCGVRAQDRYEMQSNGKIAHYVVEPDNCHPTIKSLHESMTAHPDKWSTEDGADISGDWKVITYDAGITCFIWVGKEDVSGAFTKQELHYLGNTDEWLHAKLFKDDIAKYRAATRAKVVALQKEHPIP